jgi:uncharacterized protein
MSIFFRLLALLGLLCLSGLAGCEGRSTGPVNAEPPAEVSARTIRIAAFNVGRFFDPVCDSGACGGSHYEALPSPEEFAARARQLAAAISALGAGVVLFSEVESQAALDALQERLPGFPSAVLGETGFPASVDVGVLSRHSITEVRWHRHRRLVRPDGSSTSFTREFLEVHLEVEGSKVVVFSAHFRSKRNDDPGRRLAEAQAAHELVTAAAREHPHALVVLGGDLNDEPGSPPLDALERDGALLRVSSGLSIERTWTYVFGRTVMALDHLYLAHDAGGGYQPASFRTVRDSPWGLGGSDHAAVVADFVLAP